MAVDERGMAQLEEGFMRLRLLLVPCLFLLAGGCGTQDSPCPPDSLFGDCWLPVSAQEFTGDWPLTVDGRGTLLSTVGSPTGRV